LAAQKNKERERDKGTAFEREKERKSNKTFLPSPFEEQWFSLNSEPTERQPRDRQEWHTCEG
jgi:hypothetical protein